MAAGTSSGRSPWGGFFFDLRMAVARALPLARTVAEADDLASVHDALLALGVRSELGYEGRRAVEPQH